LKKFERECCKFVNMDAGKKVQQIKRIRRKKEAMAKGANVLKYCGILKLKESPLAIQKRLRDEWQ